MRTYRPEVIHKQVEDAQDNDQHDRAPLGLESNNHHDACHESQYAHEYPPKAPIAREDEPDEQKDQQYPARQLKVHLPVLFVDLGKACGCELDANPRIGQNHEETAHDRKVAKEEIQVEYQAISQRLRDDNTYETTNGIYCLFPGDDEDGAYSHCDDIDQKEEVSYSSWDYVGQSRISNWLDVEAALIGAVTSIVLEGSMGNILCL